MRPGLPRLHAITDERVARRPDLGEIAHDLAAGGGAELAFHARGHDLSGLEHHELAVRLSVHPTARVFVNDRLDIALATRASGVQLSSGSLSVGDARRLRPAWWIGRSVHDLPEARAAQAEGADYLLVGPLFATPTHPDRAAIGLDTLHAVARLGLPAVAIGGVTLDRVHEVRRSGAWGVAAIRALWEAGDPAETARRMVEELTQ